MPGTVSVGVKLEGVKELKRALKAVGDTDAPFLRDALEAAGHILRREAAARAPGGIAHGVGFAGVKGSGANLRAVVKITHPGSRSMEFGRKWYWTGYKGHHPKAGHKAVHMPGQKARPYMGVISGGGAQDAARPEIEKLLGDAIVAEWNRLGSS